MLGLYIGIGVLVLVLLYFLLARTVVRGRLSYLSHLKCTKCDCEFDYAWVPGASFTSVRLGKSRFIRCPCPGCGAWEEFNIWDTRVDPRTHPKHLRVGPS